MCWDGALDLLSTSSWPSLNSVRRFSLRTPIVLLLCLLLFSFACQPFWLDSPSFVPFPSLFLSLSAFAVSLGIFLLLDLLGWKLKSLLGASRMRILIMYKHWGSKTWPPHENICCGRVKGGSFTSCEAVLWCLSSLPLSLSLPLPFLFCLSPSI